LLRLNQRDSGQLAAPPRVRQLASPGGPVGPSICAEGGGHSLMRNL
jgi:hypothetical protein